jgi:hypothetical protein
VSVPVKITRYREKADKNSPEDGTDENRVFDRPRLILVEGADDQAIIAAMIRHEGLEDYHVHDMRGNTSWSSRLQAVMLEPTFSMNVRSLGLIKDADSNPGAAWDSCIGVLGNCNLPIPRAAAILAEGVPSVAIMIVPSISRPGAIEDLCMSSFDEARLACVDGYFACLGDPQYARTGSKGHVQAYLAGLPTAPRDLKVAADRGTLNMASSAFDELRAFVRTLAT